MHPTEMFAIAGFAFAFASAGVYIVSILRGRSKPHIFTRLIFGILETIVFAAQLVSGGGPGAWVTGLSALFAVAIAILCIKFGTKDITHIDWFLFLGALACIGIWVATNDPLWAVTLAVTIDVLAMIPTYRKTWSSPNTESVLAWLLGTAKYFCSIFALSTFSLITLMYPIEVVVVNTVLIAIILYRRDSRAGILR